MKRLILIALLSIGCTSEKPSSKPSPYIRPERPVLVCTLHGSSGGEHIVVLAEYLDMERKNNIPCIIAWRGLYYMDGMVWRAVGMVCGNEVSGRCE